MATIWDIQYWGSRTGKSDIERWYAKLTKEQAECVSKKLILLAKYGNDLKLPHSRSLGKKLFELREKRYGYRLYYTFQDRYIIVLLAAGDKSTQKHDIKIARERLQTLIG